MGHCVQAIVTTSDVAERLRGLDPQLPRVGARQGFVILPVDAGFIDSVTGARPAQSTEPFLFLSAAFADFLRRLSRLGPIAYIETEYFGGVGGQGAAVYSGGETVMEPDWLASGPINRALGLIGVKRRLLGDRFQALGLERCRSNEDLIETADRSRVGIPDPEARNEGFTDDRG